MKRPYQRYDVVMKCIRKRIWDLETWPKQYGAAVEKYCTSTKRATKGFERERKDQALGLSEYIVSPGTLYAVRIVSHVQESVPKQIVRYISHLKLSNYKASFVSREHDLYNRITPTWIVVLNAAGDFDQPNSKVPC